MGKRLTVLIGLVLIMGSLFVAGGVGLVFLLDVRNDYISGAIGLGSAAVGVALAEVLFMRWDKER